MPYAACVSPQARGVCVLEHVSILNAKQCFLSLLRLLCGSVLRVRVRPPRCQASDRGGGVDEDSIELMNAVHQAGASSWAVGGDDAVDDEVSAGEARWAEQVMSTDWITSFEEQTSLGADDGQLDPSLSSLTHAGLQRLIEDVH